MGVADHHGSVLLVEDNAIIGIALADEFEVTGYEVIGPIASWADALCWLAERRPDVALVDVMLRDGFCVELAQQLKQQGIPFVIYSGHSQLKGEPAFQHVPWLTKPAMFRDIVAALERLRCCSQAA